MLQCGFGGSSVVRIRPMSLLKWRAEILLQRTKNILSYAGRIGGIFGWSF